MQLRSVVIGVKHAIEAILSRVLLHKTVDCPLSARGKKTNLLELGYVTAGLLVNNILPGHIAHIICDVGCEIGS